MRGIDIYKSQSTENNLSSPEEVVTLVIKIAKHFKRKLPSHIELNDLIQSGYMGYLEAKDHYQPDQGASFETFVSHRIKGAMIDELRKNSWGSRDAMKQMRLFGEAAHRIEQREQRQASPEEIARELNMTADEYLKASQKIALCQVISMTVLEDVNALPGNEDDPGEAALQADLAQKIKPLLNTLPERERLVLSLYYVEELTFKEIGEVLSLTEARICQLHATAIARVRSRLHASNPVPA